MTDSINNKPAFPQISELGDIAATSGGMTQRAYIATAALQGILTGYWGNSDMSGLGPNDFAVSAVEYADALIAALGEKP